MFRLRNIAKRDYQESVTSGQTDRQTPDKVIPMCHYALQATHLLTLNFVNHVKESSIKKKMSLAPNSKVHKFCLFSAGGYDKNLHLDRASVECYDPATDEWTFVSEMEKARSGLSLVSIDQYIYAFGGRYKHTDQYFDLAER